MFVVHYWRSCGDWSQQGACISREGCVTTKPLHSIPIANIQQYNIFRGHFVPTNARKTAITRPYFACLKSGRSFTFEFIALCAVSCYIVPRYIESIVMRKNHKNSNNNDGNQYREKIWFGYCWKQQHSLCQFYCNHRYIIVKARFHSRKAQKNNNKYRLIKGPHTSIISYSHIVYCLVT